MIHLVVLAAALLHLQDPAGDAVGDGTLAPPTAPVYADTADFDLQSVTVTDDAKLTVRVTLGSLTNPGHLANGFSNPVIEIYLNTGPGGAQRLLPGSTMVMPPNRGWNVALRATGDQVYAVTPQPQGPPGSWPHLPATLTVEGNAIVIRTDLPRPEHADVYALTGVYDPFSHDGWRPLSTTVSPWAFSSASQSAPVVDLLASGMAAQRRAIDSGVLVPYRSPTPGVGWLLLMVLGLLVAAAGLVLRRRVPRPPRRGPVAALPPPKSEEGHRRLPSFWGEMPPTEPSFLDEVEEAELWPDADSSVAAAAEARDTDERAGVEDAPGVAEPGGGGDARVEPGGPAAPVVDEAAEDTVPRSEEPIEADDASPADDGADGGRDEGESREEDARKPVEGDDAAPERPS